MVQPQLLWLYTLVLLLALSCEISQARLQHTMKSAVYLSPEFVMKPGSVVNRFYYDIKFPRGHIGLKSFNAEVVDEGGVSIPLHDTYLHHWIVGRYHIGVKAKSNINSNLELQKSDYKFVRNNGLCQNDVLGQYFGLGSETRKTSTQIPDPYAIEVGNPAEIPKGYEERWMLNVHAIDTRGVVDRSGCTECNCGLYNVTNDEYGKPLPSGYEGGLYCCYDRTQCKVKDGFPKSPRRLYLRYTVKWVDWDETLLPVKIYILDITDNWKTSQDSKLAARHHCKVEYEVMPYNGSTECLDGCIDTKRTSFIMPRRGYIIYGVAHQHSGGIGSALYRKDGEVICSSIPSYGKGKKAGNEAGYIVGMSTCYPKPGSIEILDGETLVLESNYSSSRKHTGVMGLFYILVADQLPSRKSYFESLIYIDDIHMPVSYGAVIILGLVVVFIAAVGCRRKSQGEDGYSPISICTVHQSGFPVPLHVPSRVPTLSLFAT